MNIDSTYRDRKQYQLSTEFGVIVNATPGYYSAGNIYSVNNIVYARFQWNGNATTTILNDTIIGNFTDFSNSFITLDPIHQATKLNFYIIHGSSIMWKSEVNMLPSGKEECGDYDHKADLLLAFKTYISKNGSTTHMTMIFNIFVLYIIFNQLNSRIINDDFNIFQRITTNPIFLIIFSLELLLQFLIVQYGSIVFKVALYGLTGYQWFICIIIASLTFLVALISKILPIDNLIAKNLDKINSSRSGGRENTDSLELSNI